MGPEGNMSLSKVRGGHRAMAVRYVSEIESLFHEAEIDAIEIEANLRQLKYQRDQLQDLDRQIQSTLTDESLVQDMMESGKRLTDIEKCIIRTELALKDIATTSLQNSGISPSDTGSSSYSRSIKLPILQLPVFSGNPLDWTHFWDIFRSSVHEQTDLSGAQKFSYLRGQLKDEALKLLDGFTTSDIHYDEAIKLLRETYGKPHKIIQAHLHSIFDLKTPQPNAKELSQFRANYECHIRGLKTLGTKIEEAGFVIAALLLRKLPIKIRDHINRAQKSDYWELESFRLAINSEISLLQSIEPEEKTVRIKPRNDKGNRSEFYSTRSTTGNFNVHVNTNICPYCQSKHNAYFCDKYATVEDRNKRIRELKLCINCLAGNHFVSQCKSIRSCKTCNRRHHGSVCYQRTKSGQAEIDGTKSSSCRNEAVCPVSVLTAQNVTPNSYSNAALPTAMLTIRNNNNKVKIVRALFDQGSQRSFVLKSLVWELNLQVVSKTSMKVGGFLHTGNFTEYEIVQFVVLTNRGYCTVEAIVVDSLPSEINMPGIVQSLQILKTCKVQLADRDINSDCIKNISILIGADYYYTFVSGYGVHNEIHLVYSSVGAMISGKLPLSESNSNGENFANTVTVLKIAVEDPDSTERTLKRIWELDSIGIDASLMRNEEEQVLHQFEKRLTYRDGRYTTGLPWKPNHIPLKQDYGIALGRLNSLLTRLRKVPDQLRHYNDIISDQLEKDFIEQVDPFYPIHRNAKVHYLPHHCVNKDSATTPLRVVFDCSAGSPSLNDCLYSGPSLLSELCQILLRFRLNKYACITDIAKAFLQVSLHEDDRDSTRFLWPENPWDPNSKVNLYRFKVVLFGATCSQFLLNGTIVHHLRNNPSQISGSILRNIYVDNIHNVSNNESELLQFYNDSKAVMQKAGLVLREWATNSELLKEQLHANADGADVSKPIKFLGMMWNCSDDTLGYPKQNFDRELVTKRIVVSEAAKVFDPLGILSPLIIRSRIFIQELWRLKLDWDTPLEETLCDRWNLILQDIHVGSSHIRVSRGIRIQKPIIHAFCDASEKAYGVVIYMCDDEITEFVISKVKVAPLKELTVPQLELTAATLAARLVVYLIDAYSNELQIEAINFWCDSMVVLSWIYSSKLLKPYVHNRVTEIRKLVPNATWRYVNTRENPADLITRGVTAKLLVHSTFWLLGPTWLPFPDQWPQQNNEIYSSVIANNDVCMLSSTTLLDTTDADVIRTENFSSLKKLYHVTILVFRFIDLTRKRSTKKCSLSEHCCTVDELERAELYWVKHIQKKYFGEEFRCLQNEDEKAPVLVKQLRLILVEGILRCGGRFQYSELPYDAKYPILLPNKCYFSDLLILGVHCSVHHAGVSETMNHIRQKWWIPSLRQRVRSVINACRFCKRFQPSRYAVPVAPPLPPERIIEARPFQTTGVDYTGALLVKNKGLERKVYICLFTCTVTRAIHLEVAEDNTSESFIQCFKRFVSRRSCPRVIYSDNSKTFTASAFILRKIFNHPEVKDLLCERHCEWKFIPSYSPWMGGFWERLVGLTKISLKKILGRTFITLCELQTVVTEIEAQLNDRPLTYVSNDVRDFNALTPSQLICGYRLTDIPIPLELFEQEYGERELLSKRYKRMETLKQHFWKRWNSEYLAELRQRHGWTRDQKHGEVIPIKVGDIVVIHEDGTNKLHWKLGRILKLHEGRDGLVRSVQLETSTGTTNRSIMHLYPLELHTEIKDEGVKERGDDTLEVKPVRKAALLAQSKIKSQL